MGYSTDFEGKLKITPALKPEHEAYIQAFAEIRHIKLDERAAAKIADPLREAVGLPVGYEGQYVIGYPEWPYDYWRHSGGNSEHLRVAAIDTNDPPSGVPELWISWTVETVNGESFLMWNGMEKFYSYVESLEYMIERFFTPWGYSLNGEIRWEGEEGGDLGSIKVENNVVRSSPASIIYW